MDFSTFWLRRNACGQDIASRGTARNRGVPDKDGGHESKSPNAFSRIPEKQVVQSMVKGQKVYVLADAAGC
jgi:hypothetical protein